MEQFSRMQKIKKIRLIERLVDLLTSYQQSKLKNYEIHNNLLNKNNLLKNITRMKQINKNKEIRDEISGVREKLGTVKNELKGYNTDILKLNGKISALQKSKRNNRR